MEYLDGIIKIAAVLTAIGVIWGVVRRAVQKLNKFLALIEQVREDVRDVKEHNSENYMSLLRLTIMSSEMPIGERIVAGHKYLKNGGNGEVKHFLESEFNITETVEDASHYVK